MARGWASPTLKDWCASPQARQLTAEEEISCAERIRKGGVARAALLKAVTPMLKEYLDQVAGDDGMIKPEARLDLAEAIVNTALDSWATSARPVHDFPDHLTKAFSARVIDHFHVRRHREKDFWVHQEAWLDEHFDAGGLRESLSGTVFADASPWEQLANAGAAVNDLVEHGLFIVPNVLAGLRGHGIERIPREDAESEAALALRTAAWKYSSADGKRFHHLAYPSLKNHLRSKIRTADGRKEELAKKRAHFDKVKSRLWLTLQRQPTNEEVLAAIDKWGDLAKENFRRFLEVRHPLPQDWDGAIETLPSERDEDAQAIGCPSRERSNAACRNVPIDRRRADGTYLQIHPRNEQGAHRATDRQVCRDRRALGGEGEEEAPEGLPRTGS